MEAQVMQARGPAVTADVPTVPRDVGGAIRLGMALLVIGFGGFLAWSMLVPLDEGVPAPATVVVENRSTQIQHPSGGVVAEVLVHEGQRVREGDVLLKLADVGTRSGLDELRIQWLTHRAQEARLLAEQARSVRVRFPDELLALRQEPLAQQQMALQEELFATRRRGLDSELAAMRQQGAGMEAAIAGQGRALAARAQQQALVEQELGAVRLMVQDGYTARSRQLELERTLAELRGGAAELEGNRARLHESLAEVRLRVQQREQEFRRELESQLADARREAAGYAERMKNAAEGQARTVVRAPVAGAVVGLSGTNPGSVVTPGTRLMEIVPEQGRLVLEAQIPPHLVDRIHPGLPTDVHLHSFIQLPQLVVAGRVTTVSAGSLSDPATHASYYLARVELTPEGRATLGDRVLQPGMPADVVVKTGERPLLDYLLRPLLKRFSQSLKEA